MSIRVQMTGGAMALALIAIGLAAFTAYQFHALAHITDQVNAAGRLRMLSQQAPLLTYAAAHNDEDARKRLDATLAEFDVVITQLRGDDALASFASDNPALFQVQTQWDALRALMTDLASSHRPISREADLQLNALATATLQAAEINVAIYLAKAERSQAYVNGLVLLCAIFCILLAVATHIFMRRRILAPLRALDALLNRLAAGEMSARGAVSTNDELGRLTQHVNVTAQALEENSLLQTTTMKALQDSETRNRTLWEISSEAIVIINPANVIGFANPAVEAIFGYHPEELIGQDIAILQPEHVRELHRKGMARYLQHEVRTVNWAHIETQALHKAGHAIDVDLSFSDMRLSNERLLVGTFRDITARKLQQQALLQSANFDALTGLPNRVLLHDRIEQAIALARRHNSTFGVLYLDLDNFKIINDTLGHECGDLLLCEAAERLLTCVREGDTVARLGGDEFVLLLRELHAHDDIDVVAQRALIAMSQSFNLAGSEGFVGVSIGASIFPEDAKSRVDLMQHADIAMYRAKDMGRNNYQRYAEQMQSRFKWRMSMEVQLRAAIQNQELVMHYQPQIELSSGRVLGAEALIRWESPSLGRISPVQFIPLAEETGLIVPIGNWIIQRACRDASTWLRTAFGKECSVAINLSPRQFNEPDLLQHIQDAIGQSQLGPQNFEFEVTEGLVMQNPENAAEILKSIRAMGCTVALDDFGTGYSSLASLRSFPLDILKIDKSLINDVAIVRAVIQMARSFGFKTLAEGVEDEAVLTVLRDLGCDLVQGYFYARPMPLSEFLDYLQRHNDNMPSDGKAEPV